MKSVTLANSENSKALSVWGHTFGETVPLFEQKTASLLYLGKALAIGEFDHIRPYARDPDKQKIYYGVSDEIGSNSEQWLLKIEASIFEKLRDDYKSNQYLLDEKKHA